MPSELKFNVGMNKTEFMTGSKDVARAIASLKTTVMQAGKSMNSSAVGYGTAMRQYSKVSREASQSIQSIKTRLDSLRQSTTAIKGAADSFRELSKRIESGQNNLTRMTQKVEWLRIQSNKEMAAWTKNEKAREQAHRMETTYREQYNTELERARKTSEMLKTNKDADGFELTDEQRQSTISALKEYVARAKTYRDKIIQYHNEAEQAEQKAEQMRANGEDKPSAKYLEAQAKLQEEEMAQAKRRLALNDMHEKNYENADQTADYYSQVNAIKSLEAALDAAQSKKNELIKPPYMQAWDNMTRLSGLVAEGFGRIQNVAQGALYAVTHPAQAIDRALGTVIAKVGQTISSFARMAGSSAVNFLKRLASEARNAAIQLAKMAANAVTSGFKKVASGAVAAAKGVLRFNRAHNNTGNTLKMGLRNILRYAFGIRSMFFLFRRLRAAISEGFGELKKQNPEVKASLDSLSVAFNGLKASLASAFAPILTAVAPALTTLINMLTSAMNVVAAFMAALGGGKTFSKAVGGMKATGKAAGGAGKKAKELKRELAGFDELTIINDQNKSGGGGGGGGGGSAFKYQTEQIPETIKTFVDSLKKAWEEGDYTKVGEIVAEKINGVFESALELITWENVEDKVEKGVSAVAGVFNGLTDPRKGINFKKIGITFSEGVRTLMNSIDRLVKKISTANIGIGIANFFNGILSNTALFEDAKQGLQDVTTAVTNLAAAFLKEFEEGSLAQRIRDTLGDTAMWENIGKEVWNVITLAFNKTGNFLNVLLGGEDRTQDPNVTRMMRQKPKDIVPEYQIDGTVFDDLADNFANGINGFVVKATEFIQNLGVSDVVGAIADWLIRVKNKVNWEYVGNLFGTALGKAFGTFDMIIAKFHENAKTDGANFGAALGHIVRLAFKGDTISNTFTNLVIGTFDFIKAFLEGFKPAEIAEKLREQIKKIPWKTIADDAWQLFKTALSELGNVLTVLLGGEIEPPKKEIVKPSQKQKGVVTDTGTGNSIGGLLGTGISKLATSVLDAITWAISKIDWDGLGTEIHNMLVHIQWADIAVSIWNALIAAAQGLGKLLIRSLFGASVFNDYGINENDKDYEAKWMAADDYKRRLVQLGTDADIEVNADFGVELDEETIQAAKEAAEKELNKQEAMMQFGLDPDVAGNQQVIQDLNAAIQQSLDNNEEELQLPFNLEMAAENDPELAAAIEQAKGVFAQRMAELGENADNALAASITENKGAVADATSEMAQEGIDGAENAFEIGSPSKVFENIGEMVVAGLINGLNTLPQALNGVWQNLPEWARTLLVNSASNFKLAISGGGDSGNNGGGSSAQTKETKKNTKELKKNTKKRAEIDVNYEGAGFDTSGERPTLNVGVNFAPNGEEASEENTNGGLLGWLQNLFGNSDLVVGVVAMLTGKDPSSVTIGDIFDTILKVVGFLTGKDPKSLNIGDIFGAILKIVGLLTGKDPKSLSLTDIFDTILKVIAGKPIFGAGVVASSLIDLFTGGKKVSATGTNRGSGVLVSGLIDLFTGGKKINATGTSRSKGVSVSGLIDLFTGGKKIKATGTSRSKGVSVSDLINLFTGGKKVKATGTERKDGVKKDALISLFTTTTKVKVTAVSFASGLAKTVADWFKKAANNGTKSVTGNTNAAGGIISRSGKLTRFASGGAIMRNGRASWWNSVNKYAAGTTRAHGTVFVAGENGPEIMGHVNGRTEILNKSQLADAMYGAVVAGMSNAVNSLGSYLANRMATCTNAIVSTISANSDISALAGMNYYAPAMATGGIMPYDVAMQISRSAQDIQNTLNANNEDLIQAMVSAMGNAANSIVQILQRQMMQNNISNRGNRSTDAIDVINRQSLMYGKSPLKGV